MNLEELFQYCAQHDISLFLVDNKVRVKAPDGTLTPELLSKLKAHKSAIADYLVKNSELQLNRQDDELAMSYNQRRLWFIEQVSHSNQFSLALALRWNGGVNRAALEQALRVMLERHQVLRTAYPTVDGEPVPTLLPIEAFQIEDISLSGDKSKEELTDAVANRGRHPFDLSCEYMLRVHMFHLSDNECITLINMHHIATDGWSNNIFFVELTSLYNAFVKNEANPLPVLQNTYSDFAQWQKNWLSGANLDRHLAFWRSELAHAPSLHSLPLDKKRPTLPTYNGDYYLQEIPKELYGRLQELAAKNEVTMYMLLQTAFAVVVGRYSKQQDVLIGSPVANRDESDFHGLMGFFVNTMLIRTKWHSSTTFAQLLLESSKRILDAYEHQSIPYELLLEELKVDRNLSHNAIFQILFVLQNNDTPDDVQFQGIDSQFFPFEPNISQFDLTLGAYESAGKCSLSWGYSTDIFVRKSIERLASSYYQLLEEVVNDVDRSINSINLVSSDQENRSTQKYLPVVDATSHNVLSLIMEQAKQVPTQLAVQTESEQLTYRDLVKKANCLGKWLLDREIGKGNIVAIHVTRSVDLSIVILAIMGCGAAYLPIDPDLPFARKKQLLEDAQTDLVLCNTELTGNDQCAVVNIGDLELVEQSTQWPIIEGHTNDIAYINFTSGTSGKPKGVKVSHGNLYHYCCAVQQHYKITSSDRVLQTSSLSFDACIEEHFITFTNGACLVYRNDIMLSGWSAFNEFVTYQKITVAGLPTAVWNELVATIHDIEIPAAATLRLVIIGGEALTAHRLERWKNKVGERVQLLNTYGPTEATIVSTVYDTVKWKVGESVPIGKELQSHRCYVLDENKLVVPHGVVGELCIAGDSVATGYLDETETRKAFVTCELMPGIVERVYCTGDRVRMGPEGQVEYLGREDDQIKLRGYRIELAEIDNVMAQSSTVHQVRTLVHEDSVLGKVLVAYVVFRGLGSHQEQKIKQLKAHSKAHLPEYMRPANIIQVENIPLTVQGKVDKTQLPTPEIQVNQQQVVLCPKSETEHKLHDLWCELFNLTSISIDSDFFELGGHSLLAVKLVASVKGKLSVDLAIRDLFEYPSIEELSARIDSDPRFTQDWVDLDQELLLRQTAVSTESIPSSECDKDKPIIRMDDNVLLTGSTGFVGAHLLIEILSSRPNSTVFCLVRAPNEKSAMLRIVANLNKHGLWCDSYQNRIRIVLGDLSKSDAGISPSQWQQLTTSIQWIVHNGAKVNHLAPYSALEAANVDGTAALLRLANSNVRKLFSFVSTIGALNPSSNTDTLTEDSDLTKQRHDKASGYPASKWVAEGLIQEASKKGLTCHVFRLGRVSAHSQTGHSANNDILARYLLTCKALGTFPEDDKFEKMIPVDTVAKTIVSLGQSDPDTVKTWHLIGRDLVGWNHILSQSHWNIQRCSFFDWLDELGHSTKGDNPLPFAPYWLGMKKEVEQRSRALGTKNTELNMTISQRKTEADMARLGIDFPTLDTAYWTRYLNRLDLDLKTS